MIVSVIVELSKEHEGLTLDPCSEPNSAPVATSPSLKLLTICQFQQDKPYEALSVFSVPLFERDSSRY